MLSIQSPRRGVGLPLIAPPPKDNSSSQGARRQAQNRDLKARGKPPRRKGHGDGGKKGKAILRLAQEVWRDEFASARKSPAEPRIDLGCKRGPRQPSSETQWLQRRRESIIEGAASSGASSLDALSLDAIVVSETQKEEIEFNKQKLLKKKGRRIHQRVSFAERSRRHSKDSRARE